MALRIQMYSSPLRIMRACGEIPGLLARIPRSSGLDDFANVTLARLVMCGLAATARAASRCDFDREPLDTTKLITRAFDVAAIAASSTLLGLRFLKLRWSRCGSEGWKDTSQGQPAEASSRSLSTDVDGSMASRV